MLQVIYGGSASGKTHTVMQKIKADAENGKSAVLLVPEQFSFESERAVLNMLGDKLSKNVEVISFTSLADNIALQVGGNKEILSDADKIVFMVRALRSLKDVLPIWRKYLSSPKFASRVVDMIGEFKVSSVTADDLASIVDTLSEGSLKTKLDSLEKAWRAYDALVESRFIDPADKLTVLYRQLLESEYFKNKNVYIDSFNGFTGQQKKIIEKILVDASLVCVAVTCDDINSDELNIFYNNRNNLKSIIRAAQKHNVKILPEISLSQTYYESKEMNVVKNSFTSNKAEIFEDKTDNVIFCHADSATDEADFATLQIRRLVRERGFRYRDFAVIARNSENYESAIDEKFIKNGIPCFFDKKVSLSASPVYRLISCAYQASKKLASKDVLGFLKTGLVYGFTQEDLNRLENYVFLWNIDGELWNKNWDMDPKGFVADEDNDEFSAEVIEELEELNKQRRKAVNLIKDFKESFCGSVTDMSKAIYNLLKACKTDLLMGDFLKTLPKDISEEDKDTFRQSFDKTVEVLDGLVKCLKDENLSADEFMDAFLVSCDMTKIGRVPQLIDQVTFASAERICPSNFKFIFILGANQGVFPAFPENNSLLCNNDRRKLIDAGLEIRDKTVQQSIDENLLVYACVCAASTGICLCSNSSSDGSSAEPASFFTKLETVFKNALNVKYPNEEINGCLLPETKWAGFNLLCNIFENGDGQTAALKQTVLADEAFKEKFEVTTAPICDSDLSLSHETALGLYGKTISGSATRFDTFHLCHFRYFCQYGLKTARFQPASLDVMQRGTLVHFVLEKFCNRHLDDIGTVKDETIVAETEEFTSMYLSLIKGSKSIFTPRFVFLLTKIKEGIKDVLFRMVREFAQGEFKPKCCEVSIAPNGVIEPVEFDFESGKFKLYGSIDRLDTFGGYVRIVDYKTGSKTFKISDTLYGLNMQMLLYLYAVVRGSNSEYNSKKPAGILYMPSKFDINKEGLAMNGLLCDDVSVIKAMDNEMQGEFVPEFKVNKDGTPSKTNTSFVSYDDFNTIFDYIEKLACDMGRALHSGDIKVDPIDTSTNKACQYCDYKAVCGIEEKEHRYGEKFENSEVLMRMRGEECEV